MLICIGAAVVVARAQDQGRVLPRFAPSRRIWRLTATRRAGSPTARSRGRRIRSGHRRPHATVRQVDPAERALLELSSRHGMSDQQLADFLGVAPDDIARRRSRATRGGHRRPHATVRQVDPAERALLELSSRHGMSDQQLADFLGVAPDDIARRRSRAIGEGLRAIGRRGRLATAVVVSLAVVAALAVGGDSLARVSEELGDLPGIATGSGEDPSERLVEAESSRPAHWAAALEAFWANPLTGTGPGTYEFWWNRGGAETFARDAHSLYLEHLAEGGLPGFVLILALVGSLVVLALRGRARWDDADSVGVPVAAAAAMIVFAVHAGLDWLWEVPAVTALALLCAAVASAPTEDRPRPSALVRTAAAATALVACLLQVPALASTLKVEESQAAFRSDELEAAEEAAEEAVDLQPWAASPYVQRALLAEVDGRLDEARRYVESAIEREPTNWVHWELLARIEDARDEPQAAMTALEEARRLRPIVPSFKSPSGSSRESPSVVAEE